MTILIVDDNPLMRQLVERFLSEMDYPVAAVESAAAAISWCQVQQPTLLIIDLYLADMEAPQLLRHLRKLPNTSQTPALVLSGVGEADQLRRLAPGFDDYLLKPVDLDVLLEAVQRNLGT